jgi:D-amino-acid dehydrogenase
MRTDIVVLGAGIVGICVALHLQKRARSVVLVDRRGAAEETSFGNAGLIQREGVYPYGFPHDFGALLRYGLNRTIDAYYHPSALPRLAPFLLKYWRYSRPARHAQVARYYSKLIEHCVSEHDALATEAGATGFLRRSGWMKVFRTERERDRRFAEAERWNREFGINYRAIDSQTLQTLEPHVAPVLVGALHWTDPVSVNDPHGLALAYLRAFEGRSKRVPRSSRSVPGPMCSRAPWATIFRWR